MNWYTETELRHGIGEWEVLREGFLLTFTFEDCWSDTMDDALQAVKAAIFKIPQEPMEVLQPEWAMQLSSALECYNVNVEEDDEDSQNINISETKGSREVREPSLEDPDITALLKMKQVNIGTEVEPKYATLGNYWDDSMVDKVAELLREYQDLFPTKITDLKGNVGDLGTMNITLKLDVKPVEQQPYYLNPKYKEKVRGELEKMLIAEIIEPVEESDWVIPLVV